MIRLEDSQGPKQSVFPDRLQRYKRLIPGEAIHIDCDSGPHALQGLCRDRGFATRAVSARATTLSHPLH